MIGSAPAGGGIEASRYSDDDVTLYMPGVVLYVEEEEATRCSTTVSFDNQCTVSFILARGKVSF